MTDLIREIKQNHLEHELWQSLMGVEVETQRVNTSGKLSRQPYPVTLGSRSSHPNLQTDFGETQTEWITDPLSNDHQLIMQLQALHDVFVREMDDSDRLWLLSMPPALTHEDRLFVREHFDRPKYQHYRDYLDGKYGIAHGLTTGVHLNFSITDKLIDTISKSHSVSKAKTANVLYWRVVQNFLKYRWLLTYFFGASPVVENGYFKNSPRELQEPVRSIRNSNIGFNNGGQTHISYTSFDQHIKDLQEAINNGELYAQMEFYGPVRIKGQAHIPDYKTEGIKYLEFRVFDTNPFVPLGIDENEVKFVRAFLTFCLLQPIDPNRIRNELKDASLLNNIVALQTPSRVLPNLIDAKELFHRMVSTLKKVGMPKSLEQAIALYQSQLDNPEATIAGRLLGVLSQGSLTPEMLSISNYHFAVSSGDTQEIITDVPFSLNVQAMIAAAIKIGLHVDWPLITEKIVVLGDSKRYKMVKAFSSKITANEAYLLAIFSSH
ncbi:Glutathione synthase [Furfurilactobacillus rossiae]|uniref:gamma-glutamylcysteine synthetase n=1 Tax=Furfurilactobacillus rossiae TaxID=231049 RepID=UPI0015B83A9B|nr:gamma-glutamylcysteine synthetase [Furfurilactobacillus rossiae]MCF6165006.1 gamma-glutamylcysteine synthetase [Furfurilactobacillus rossiae]QLE64078.1 Glutathione synthase [Furfurilactobacillus rossiae]